MISEKHELKWCVFQLYENKYSFYEILISFAMSINDRGTLGFPSSKQLINEIYNILRKENRTVNNCDEERKDRLG